MPSVTASRGNGKSAPAARRGSSARMETPLKTQLLLARCTLRPLVRAGDGPEMIQSGSISHISINPIVLSGWVSTRSLCLPAQVAEQCLLLSQVFTPDCLGFGFWFLVFGFRFLFLCCPSGNPRPWPASCWCQAWAEQGGLAQLLLVLLPLHFKTIRSR